MLLPSRLLGVRKSGEFPGPGCEASLWAGSGSGLVSCSTPYTSYLNSSSQAILLQSDQQVRQQRVISMTEWRLVLELLEVQELVRLQPTLRTLPLRTRRLTLRTSS